MKMFRRNSKRVEELEFLVEDLMDRINLNDAALQGVTVEAQRCTRENVALHNRISMANQRSAHIEHYVGLRSHSFKPGERMWAFHQLLVDVNAGSRPVSLFSKGVHRQKINGAAAA
jgi:hypothetical protein